jgi:hypothetical protein
VASYCARFYDCYLYFTIRRTGGKPPMIFPFMLVVFALSLFITDRVIDSGRHVTICASAFITGAAVNILMFGFGVFGKFALLFS